MVCEVTFSEWTGNKHLRHPVFKGLRTDKNKNEVLQEVPENINVSKKKMKATIATITSSFTLPLVKFTSPILNKIIRQRISNPKPIMILVTSDNSNF